MASATATAKPISASLKAKKQKDPNSRGSRAFAYAQKIGKSLFLPIAILPFAGILLGIGSSFTNATTIAAYGLEGILHPGTLLYSIMLLFAEPATSFSATSPSSSPSPSAWAWRKRKSPSRPFPPASST